MKPHLKALGDFAQQVARASCPAKFRELNPELPHLVRKAAMAEGSGVTGGFTVPTDLELSLGTILEQKSPFYLHGYVQPMKHETQVVPGVDIAAGNASGTSVNYGGMKASWQAEAATVSESEPSFTGPTLNARNLQCDVRASNQLVWDGGEALGAYLYRLFELALLWQTTYAFIQGNGADQPAGIASAPATVVVSRQTTVTVTMQDLGGLIKALVPASFPRSVWIMNPSAFAKVVQLSQYVINGWHYKEEGAAGFLFTRPVFVTDQCPVVGTKGDVILFDPCLYCVGFRSMELAASDVPNYTKLQTDFRLIWRGDGQPLARNTVTLADGSTTAGIASVLSTL